MGRAIVRATMNLLTHQGQYKLQQVHQKFLRPIHSHLYSYVAILYADIQAGGGDDNGVGCSTQICGTQFFAVLV